MASWDFNHIIQLFLNWKVWFCLSIKIEILNKFINFSQNVSGCLALQILFNKAIIFCLFVMITRCNDHIMGKSCKLPGYTLYVRLEQHTIFHTETYLCMCVLISFNKQLKYFIQHFSCTLHRNRTSSVAVSEKKEQVRKVYWVVFANLSMLGEHSPPILIFCKKSGDDGLSQLWINNRGSKYAYVPFNSSSSL